MKFPLKRFGAGLLLVSGLALSGCLPSNSGPLDEEKEPHFLEGKSRVNSMDYAGAMDSFEQALEANPKSAAAHFELGCLCDQREADPAAAIYHYSAYLKLRPGGDKSERARTRIAACKQELARTVSLGPVTQGLQRESEQLAEENRQLKAQLEQWQAYFKATTSAPARTSLAQGAAPGQSNPANRVAADVEGARGSERRSATGPAAGSPGSTTADPARLAGAAATGRTHIVKAGETPAAIARQYGVKVDALMAANPRVDARRLQVGQVLAVPSL